MKTRLLFIALSFSSFLWGQPTTSIVPNGDFENWNIQSYIFPENFLFNSNAFKAKSNMPYNVIQTSDSYHGQSAVKLVTDNATDNVNFGFIIGSNGENGDPTTWKGGIPITQAITGIRGYYKYDFVNPDSALVIVTFKYQGAFLAEYDFFLKEKKANYTLFDFDIVPKWSNTISPDTVIVGFASSGNVQKGSGQPGSTFIIDSISFKGVTTQPEALNGDFERWTQHSTPMPQVWNLTGTEVESEWRTTDKYEGNYAVKLTTYLGRNEKNEPAEHPQTLYLGNINQANGKWSGGMRLANTMDTLSFWYKYIPSIPTDTASLMLMMLNNGIPITGNSVPLLASAQYREMKISMQSPNLPNSLPCDLVLMFNSSIKVNSTMEHVGSSLYLDHVTILPYKGKIDIIPTSNNPVLVNESFEIWDSRPFEIPEGYPYSSNLLRMDGSFPYNASKTSLAQHGNYSLRLETDGMVGNNFGFIINEVPSGPNPANWKGGIPISGKPTGLQGYYLFNSIIPDSATIMVFFKKGGLNIGSYYLNLLPATGDWSFFNKPFFPPMTETPDSMIIGIVSSSNTSGAIPTGSILMIDNISFTGIATQPEKLNGDFENWVTTRIETAPGWFVSDQKRPSAHQSTNAAVGTYAMEIRTTMQTNEQGQPFVEPMWMSNGNWSSTVQDWVGGSPLNTLNDTLAFYYRYIPAVPNDTAQLSMMFKFQGQVVANNGAYLLPNTAWQFQEVPLMQQQGMGMMFPTDSILFYFQSSLWNHNSSIYAGSTLLLDDVHFKSSRYAVGVKTVAVSPKPEIYPNPCQGVARIRFSGKLPESLDVFNVSGQKIRSITKSMLSDETMLDLTDQPTGLYIVRIIGAQKTETLKLILK